MAELPAETNTNILDLAGFRTKKYSQISSQVPGAPLTSIGVSQKEMGSHIENIKKSIQRINKLMEELRTISDKPNK